MANAFYIGLIVFSGFVLSVHDRWFWVTAGHCLGSEGDDGLDDTSICWGGYESSAPGLLITSAWRQRTGTLFPSPIRRAVP